MDCAPCEAHEQVEEGGPYKTAAPRQLLRRWRQGGCCTSAPGSLCFYLTNTERSCRWTICSVRGPVFAPSFLDTGRARGHSSARSRPTCWRTISHSPFRIVGWCFSGTVRPSPSNNALWDVQENLPIVRFRRDTRSSYWLIVSHAHVIYVTEFHVTLSANEQIANNGKQNCAANTIPCKVFVHSHKKKIEAGSDSRKPV